MGIMDKIINTTADVIRKAQMTTVNTLESVQNEESELYNIKGNISAIDGELNAAYTQIGKKYFECIFLAGADTDSIEASDVLELAKQKRERKTELEKELLVIEKRLKDQVVLQEKLKVQAEYEAQIERLNTAKSMGVLSEKEYEEKASKMRKRVENFEDIRNVEKQFEMGIITLSEKEKKISELLGSDLNEKK